MSSKLVARSKLVAEAFSSMEGIAHASKETLQMADEVGPKVAEAIVQYFNEPGNRELIGRLRKASAQPPTPQQYREAKQLIEQAGGKISTAVSKKTSYLVVGEDAGSKLDKAKELGIVTLTEEELRKLLTIA